jgi:hypothetical protein
MLSGVGFRARGDVLGIRLDVRAWIVVLINDEPSILWSLSSMSSTVVNTFRRRPRKRGRRVSHVTCSSCVCAYSVKRSQGIYRTCTWYKSHKAKLEAS